MEGKSLHTNLTWGAVVLEDSQKIPIGEENTDKTITCELRVLRVYMSALGFTACHVLTTMSMTPIHKALLAHMKELDLFATEDAYKNGEMNEDDYVEAIVSFLYLSRFHQSHRIFQKKLLNVQQALSIEGHPIYVDSLYFSLGNSVKVVEKLRPGIVLLDDGMVAGIRVSAIQSLTKMLTENFPPPAEQS